MDQDQDRLADVVNHEPIVFYDCTQSELLGAMLTSAGFGVIAVAILAVAIGNFAIGLIGGMVAAVGVCWLVMTWLKNIRQKYYATWLPERVFLFKQALVEVTGARSAFINESTRFGKGVRRG